MRDADWRREKSHVSITGCYGKEGSDCSHQSIIGVDLGSGEGIEGDRC